MLQEVIAFCLVFLPPDASLTCSNVLAAVNTVKGERLGDIIRVPDTKKVELKNQYKGSSTREYCTELIQYYLHTNPYSSWERLGSHLLYWEEYGALKEVKKRINRLNGMGRIINEYTVTTILIRISY